LGKSEPVTADTIFAVGSMTKSFTAATVAAMVDEKKLDRDKPVRQYLPLVPDVRSGGERADHGARPADPSIPELDSI